MFKNSVAVKRKMRYNIKPSSSSSSSSSSDDQLQQRTKSKLAIKRTQNRYSSSDSSSSDSDMSKDRNSRPKYQVKYVRPTKNLGNRKEIPSHTSSDSDDESGDFLELTVKNRDRDASSSESTDSSEDSNHCVHLPVINKRGLTSNKDSSDSSDETDNYVHFPVRNKEVDVKSSDSSDSTDERNHHVDLSFNNKKVDASSSSDSSDESDQRKELIPDTKVNSTSSRDAHEDNRNKDASNVDDNRSDIEDLLLFLEDDEDVPEQLCTIITETSELVNTNNTVPKVNTTTSQGERVRKKDDTTDMAVPKDIISEGCTTVESEDLHAEDSDEASYTTMDTGRKNSSESE